MKGGSYCLDLFLPFCSVTPWYRCAQREMYLYTPIYMSLASALQVHRQSSCLTRGGHPQFNSCLVMLIMDSRIFVSKQGPLHKYCKQPWL